MDEGLTAILSFIPPPSNSSSMTFWVNFADVRLMPSGEKIVSYHMEHVFTYALRSMNAVLYLGRVCHNILDWGVRTRLSRGMMSRNTINTANASCIMRIHNSSLPNAPPDAPPRCSPIWVRILGAFIVSLIR